MATDTVRDTPASTIRRRPKAQACVWELLVPGQRLAKPENAAELESKIVRFLKNSEGNGETGRRPN